MCLATMPYVYAACRVHVTIFSTGGKFQLVSNFKELHTLTLAAHSTHHPVFDSLQYAKLEGEGQGDFVTCLPR